VPVPNYSSEGEGDGVTKTSTIHVIYRCKRDKLTIRRTFEQTKDFYESKRHDHTYGYSWNVMELSKVTFSENGEVVGLDSIPDTPCTQCCYDMTKQPIKGYIVDTVRCAPKCVNAVGPSCDCECGGENHGRTYQNNKQMVTA
jgi:hypothetical protein